MTTTTQSQQLNIHKVIASRKPILVDGGLETTLVFHHQIDMPHFAAFDLMKNPQHRQIIDDYYREYLKLAIKYNTDFILESPTWRANPDWGYKLGYSEPELMEANEASIRYMKSLAREYEEEINHIFISGCLGPRSDGYEVGEMMDVSEAMTYHMPQIRAFKNAGADMVSALTMNYAEEALGITFAAKFQYIPVVISFTLETDGRLPNGQTLQEAIGIIERETESYPLYYMINCAHPTHFMHQMQRQGKWKDRIMGIRANASCKSHAELDEATELDTGDIDKLAVLNRTLKTVLPNLTVFGGCCGTDSRHIDAIGRQIAGMKN